MKISQTNNIHDKYVDASGVRENNRKMLSQGSVLKPEVKPKGSVEAISNRDSSNITEILEALKDSTPYRGIVSMGDTEVL